MAKWLIVLIVKIIILENRKWFWISYSNSNTFHVESIVRFKNMQKLFKFIFKHFSNSLSNTCQKKLSPRARISAAAQKFF